MRTSCFLLLATLFACGVPDGEYANSDADLAVGHGSGVVCSCAFVMGLSDQACIERNRLTPDLVRYVIDRKNRRVEATALLMWTASARWVDDDFGCMPESPR